MVDEVEGMSLLALRGIARSKWALAAKRAMDVVGAALGLMLLAPLMGVMRAGLSSPGPMSGARQGAPGSQTCGHISSRATVVGRSALRWR